MVDDNKETFGKVFCTFSALNDTFQYYCSLINIDSTHVFCKYKAKLLIAVSYNINNEVYLLYFAIVEKTIA